MAVKTKTDVLNELIGSDLKFPISGDFVPIKGLDLIVQDISQLLLTIPGERVFRPTYGCNLRLQVWENIDDAAINGAAAIRTALDKFEPRINVTSVGTNINRNTDFISFNVKFVVKDTDVTQNLVIPFRLASQISNG
jgi:phage baseplate assembly protein W